MADFPMQLAQLIAQSKQSQFPMGQQQRPMELSQIQNVKPGWGPVGAAFGKGVGDYVNDTFLKAEKNKYMVENDPIEIEKRASQFAEVFNNMTPEEQDKVEKMLNSTPQGLKMRDKFKKYAKYLFVDYPEEVEGQAGISSPHPKAGWTRPVQLMKTEAQQKALALQGMPQDKRNENLFAGEAAQQASAGLHRAQTEGYPRVLAADERRAAASETQAKAAVEQNRQQAEQHGFERVTKVKSQELEEKKFDLEKQVSKAQIDYYKARDTYLRAKAAEAGKMDPAKARIMLAEKAAVDKQVGSILNQFNKIRLDLANNATTADEVNNQLVPSSIEAAMQMKAIDPTHPAAIGVFEQGAEILVSEWHKFNESIKGKNLFFWQKQPEMDPKWGNMAAQLLHNWGTRIGTKEDLDAFLDTYERVGSLYWKQLYPEAKDPKDARRIIDSKIKVYKERGTKALIKERLKQDLEQNSLRTESYDFGGAE